MVGVNWLGGTARKKKGSKTDGLYSRNSILSCRPGVGRRSNVAAVNLLSLGFPSVETDGDGVGDGTGSKRALEILCEMPPNRHLLQPLARLLRSTDPFVRSKAALMCSRASDNPEWVLKMLADPDVRVRANAVEGLWKTKAATAGAVFKAAALDPDHRVQINALLGLHFIGDTSMDLRAAFEKIASTPNVVVRAAAAYAMGRIMNAIYVPVLEGLLKDDEQKVRRQALQALISIRRQNRRDATPTPPGEPPPAAEVAATNEPFPIETAS
jgi:HEAT repeat protein